VVKTGDVLVSTVRPNLQTIAIVPKELDGEVASTGFCVLRPGQDLDPRWLFYWTLSPTFLESLLKKTRGVSYPAVLDKDVRAAAIPLPPIDEQRQIVAWIGSLDAALDAGMQRLEEAYAQLRMFRAASYASAFVGESQRGEEMLGSVAAVQSGLAKGRPGEGAASQIPYLRTANVQAGFLDLEEVKVIGVTAEQRARYQLKDGDVLVLEGGDADKVGRGWLWEGQLVECLHQNHVFAVRPGDRLRPRFLAHYINAPPARTYFLSVAKQTTNLASINKTTLKGLPVPMFALDQQDVLVEELDERLASADRMRVAIEVARMRLGDLRRSALRRAFQGELHAMAPPDSVAA